MVREKNGDTDAAFYPLDLTLVHQNEDRVKASAWNKDGPPIRWTTLLENVK